MELRHLRIFAEVVKQGGFSAAAKTLGSTQSTVSKVIQQLEHDCGMPLLDRLPHGIKPTDTGEAVLQRARTMLAEQERLESDLAARRGLEIGSLRIGVPPLGSATIFAPLIAKYRKLHPGIRIDLLEEGSNRLESAVQSGEIEVGGTLLPAPESLAWQPVREEPMMALLPAGHPLWGRKSIEFFELDGNPCILFERGFALNAIIASACRKKGIELHEVARSSQAEFIIALVAAGLGIALLPRIIATSHGGVKAVLIEDSDLLWRLGLIWRQGSPLSRQAQNWVDLVRKHSSPAP